MSNKVLYEIARETWGKLVEVGLANLGRKTATEILMSALQRAVDMEREACADLADVHIRIHGRPTIGDEIRSRRDQQ